MKKRCSCARPFGMLVLCALSVTLDPAVVHGVTVGFDAEQWMLGKAEIVAYMGRTCLAGMAYLKDVEFENGVIEVDVAVDGSTSYPGIIFRMQSENDCERFYLRPHRAGLYPDALQYTPVFNGIAGWQLYNGDGYTAGADIPAGTWIRVRLEVHGKQARVFLGSAGGPALVIHDLKHGVSRGTIGLMGPNDKTAYFADFSYRVDDSLHFDPPPEVETPPGMITEWELSQTFRLSELDMERYPSGVERERLEWRTVRCEPSGLLDIARYSGRSGREPDCIYARTFVPAGKGQSKKLLLGYSDAVSVFLNGKILFTGNSSYRLRDPSFLGIIGLNDAVYLPLEKGQNELLLVVAESFGGWGLLCQDGNAIFQHAQLRRLWETKGGFRIPESVAYDGKRNLLFVSNYDGYNASTTEGRQFISKVAANGKVEALQWVTGIFNPTGIVVYGDVLYVVERKGLVEIDIDSKTVARRFPVPGAVFLNDAAVDHTGTVYVSDSGGNAIYRCAAGTCEMWMQCPEISRPNGLHVRDNALIVGNNGDSSIKSIDLATKEIRTIATLSPGIIDGVKTDAGGNCIVSHWEGKLYRITPSGAVTKLLDTTVPRSNIADLEYIVDTDTVIIPTFSDNGLAAYRLAQ